MNIAVIISKCGLDNFTLNFMKYTDAIQSICAPNTFFYNLIAIEIFLVKTRYTYLSNGLYAETTNIYSDIGRFYLLTRSIK